MASNVILGACTNGNCSFSGSCQMFCPDDGLASNSQAQNQLAKKCICRCFGAQHKPVSMTSTSNVQAGKAPVTSDTPTVPSPPTTEPISTSTSTSSSHFDKPDVDKGKQTGSSIPPPINSFHGYAQKAQEKIRMQGRNEERFKAAFDVHSDAHHRFSSSTKSKKKRAEPVQHSDSEEDCAPPPFKKTTKDIKSKDKAKAKTKSGKASAAPAPTPVPSKSKKAEPALKASDQSDFAVVLVHDTKAVYSPKGMEKPNVASLRTYQSEGYMNTVHLNANMSVWDIDYKVADSFMDTEYAGGILSKLLTAWQLLVNVPQGNGKPDCLRPMKIKRPGNVTYKDLVSVRIPAYRGTTNADFKSVVFIALLPDQPNIPVAGLEQYTRSIDDQEDEEDDDMEGESGDDDEQASAVSGQEDGGDNEDDLDYQPGQRGRGRGQGQGQHASGRKEQPNEEAADVLHVGLFEKALRTTLNIRYDALSAATTRGSHATKASTDERLFYPSYLSYPYLNAIRSMETLSSLREVAVRDPSSSSFANLAQGVESYLRSIDFLLHLAEWGRAIEAEVNLTDQLADRSDFKQAFLAEYRLGPYGLTPIIELLVLIDSLIHHIGKTYLSVAECNGLINKLNLYAQAIIDLTLFFKQMTPRAVYEPGPFKALRHSLFSTTFSFEEADETERLSVLSLVLGTSTVSEFVGALVQDFGSVDSALAMKSESIKIGPHGLTGLINNIFVPFLDDMPTSHPDYPMLYDLFSGLASALAHKIENIKKSGPRKKKAAGGSTASQRRSTRSSAAPSATERGGENEPLTEDDLFNKEEPTAKGENDGIDAHGGLGEENGPNPRPDQSTTPEFEFVDSEFDPEDSEEDVVNSDDLEGFDYKGPSSPPHGDNDDFKDIPDLSNDSDPDVRFWWRETDEFVKTGKRPSQYPGANPRYARESFRNSSSGSSWNGRKKGSAYDWSWMDDEDHRQHTSSSRRMTPFNLQAASAERVAKELTDHYLAKYGPQTALYRAVLTLVPHPDSTRAKTLEQLGYIHSEKKTHLPAWRKLVQIYHSDKNIIGTTPGITRNVSLVFEAVTKLLTNYRPL